MMARVSFVAFALFSCLSVLFVFSAFFWSGGFTGSGAADPIVIPPGGYQGFPGWTPPGEYVPVVGQVYRAVPSHVLVPDEVWNFGSLQEILNVAMSQLEYAKVRGSVSSAQYEMLMAELFNIQQALGVCINDVDAKAMIRSRYGGSGKAFTDLYPKMIACMKSKVSEQEAKAAVPAKKMEIEEPKVLRVPKTIYDYVWTFFVYGDVVQEGRLDLYNYSGEFYLPKDAEPVAGIMEVVQGGFVFRTAAFELKVDGISDPGDEFIEVRKGGIVYADGTSLPVIIRRVRVS